MTLRHALKATERSLIQSAVRTTVRVGARIAPARTAQAIADRFFATARPAQHRQPFRGARPEVDAIAVPDGAVTTYRWGEADRPTVLLMHGWNGYAQQMEAFVEPLTTRGFAVLAFDHVAHGRSDGHATSLPVMIRSTERVMETVPDVVGAIAHSLGAAALASVLSATRRAFAGAVLIAPPSDPRPYLRGLARMLGAPEDLLEHVQARAEATAGVPFERLVMQPWIARRIRTPLLVAHDVDDREVPIASGYSYTMGTGARMLATDGLGHTRILRDRHVVETAVDFVTRRVRRGALALAA